MRIADVVLLELAGPPARHVEPAIVDRQVDVGHQRWDCAERLERGRELVGLGRLGGDGDDLLHLPALTLAVPHPHRRGQVLDADHHADEAPRLAGVVGGPHLEHHLVLVAQVDSLDQLSL